MQPRPCIRLDSLVFLSGLLYEAPRNAPDSGGFALYATAMCEPLLT